MKVKVGISNRHVHLNQNDLELLFGKNYELTKLKAINQPGQFAASECVTLKTTKNQIENVRILGPVREYTQAEISRTDAYTLGLNPPVRASGNLEDSAVLTIVGPLGAIERQCCIIADRHIHIKTSDLAEMHLKSHQKVKLKITGVKGGILDDVYIKDSMESYYEAHLDTDDANAFLLKNNDEVEILIEE